MRVQSQVAIIQQLYNHVYLITMSTLVKVLGMNLEQDFSGVLQLMQYGLQIQGHQKRVTSS